MIVRRFLAWSRTASAGERAEGASALARAYLYSDLGETDQREAGAALTALVDDASPIVRRALAEAFASAVEAPHHCIVILANDQSDIASVVLSRSPLLGDDELIDCAAVGDAFAQAAIAVRSQLSRQVCAALAEVGAREALIALAVNENADLPDFSITRMLSRFGADGELREALLSRRDLSPALRAELVAAAAQALNEFVTSRRWLSAARADRVTREAGDKAAILLAGSDPCGESAVLLELVHGLRTAGRLTSSLLMRALLSGNRRFFEAALAELSCIPIARAEGIVRAWRGGAFTALYSRAGLQAALEPAFRAALEAQDGLRAEENFVAVQNADCAPDAGGLLSPLVERVITACENLDCADLGKLMALLRRFEAEAALDYARAAAADVANLSQESAPVAADPLEIDEEAHQCDSILLSAA